MNHYITLGVHKSSTEQEVRSAYLALAKQNHPDHHANDAAKAAKMAEINVAYAIVGDVKKRKAYDKKQTTLHGACEACGGKGCTAKQKGFTKKVNTICPACGGAGTGE